MLSFFFLVLIRAGLFPQTLLRNLIKFCTASHVNQVIIFLGEELSHLLCFFLIILAQTDFAEAMSYTS